MEAIIMMIGAGIAAFLFLFLPQKIKSFSSSIRVKSSETKTKSITSRKDALIDYDVYTMTVKERIYYTVLAAAVIFALAYLFYRSIAISILLSPLSLIYPGIKTREIIKQRKNELTLQFKELLYALSSSLSAGKSIEMAFKDALKDLKIIYPEQNAYIINEIEYIARKIEMNETIEDALSDFADRAHIEDINNFVDVFLTTRRTGGNIIEIIKNTSTIIRDKLEVKQEIETMIAGKKMEQKVISIMPIFLILMLSTTSHDYMEPVFTTLIGRIVMTLSLILIIIGYIISNKITNIEV